MTQRLTLSDVADQREYERTRPEFLREVIALKQLRRISLGPHVTIVFENRTTVLFQVQEMARAERMMTDAQIQTELDIYNPLIGEAGELSMTMFIELTSDEQLRMWLPRLAGIERSIEVRIGEGANSVTVPAELDAQHASQLTREEITAAVHYLKATFGTDLARRFATDQVTVRSKLAAYQFETILSEQTKASVLADWAVS